MVVVQSTTITLLTNHSQILRHKEGHIIAIFVPVLSTLFARFEDFGAFLYILMSTVKTFVP